MPDVPLLGQSDARERAAEAADENVQAPPMVEADTAFLVLWREGTVLVSPDLDAAVVSKRYPTPDDITGACAVLLKNLSSERTVGLMINQQQQAMQRLQQHQLNQQAQNLIQKERNRPGNDNRIR